MKTIKNGIQFKCETRALLPHVWGKSINVVGQMYASKIFTELMVSMAFVC
jgi:hypothetical protein